MVQVIQGKEGFGSLLGRHVGGGLQQSLSSLAEHKLQSMLQGHKATALTDAAVEAGFAPELAKFMAHLPPPALTAFLQRLSPGDFGQQQEQQPSMANELQQLVPEQQQQQAAPQQRMTPLSGQDAIMQALQQYQQQAPQQMQQQVTQQPQQMAAQQGAQQQHAPQQKRASTVAEIFGRPSPEQQLKVDALKQQRQQHLEKLSAKQQQEVDKETKPYYDEIYKGAKAAKESDIRLDRMERLIHRGNLTKPGWVAAVESISKIPVFGVDLSWALHPDTQEFQKLSTDFLKNAKDYFGTRLTDADLKAFLQTIPNAKQTNQAKLRVISNLRSFNEIAKIKKKAADDIIKRNNGRRPANFDSLVDDATAPEVDKIANKFKRNINEDALGVI
jgi:hypothetical protein